MADTSTAAPSSDHTPALSTSAAPASTTGPDAAERLAGLVILLGDIASLIIPLILAAGVGIGLFASQTYNE